jgi:hypothetical protein
MPSFAETASKERQKSVWGTVKSPFPYSSILQAILFYVVSVDLHLFLPNVEIQ